MFCELHTHSTESDGSLTRAEVIELAIKNDVGILAITDHNIFFDDLDELQTKYPDIKLINGSEVSTSYMVPDTGELREIHVVALDFDNTKHFVSLLRRNRYDSEDYVNRIIQKLREAGLEANFTYNDLRREMKQAFIGRMAVARKLASLGLVSDIEEAFDEYIGDFGERRAYVKPNISKYISMDIAVAEIRYAGGIPILCHPYSYNFNEEQVIRLIQDFKKIGGLAMETLYAAYTPEQQEQLIIYGEKYGLIESAASDFHGRGKKGSLANQFPISYAEQLLAISKEERKKIKNSISEE